MGYENKEEPEGNKESIEEILSDLNGLLNKMPSILSDIKMPEIVRKDFEYAPQDDNRSQNGEASPQAEVAQPEIAHDETDAEFTGAADEENVDLELKKGDLSVDKETMNSNNSEDIPNENKNDVENLDFMVSGEDLSESKQKDAQVEIESPEPIETPIVSGEETKDFLGQTRDFGVPDIDALLSLSSDVGDGQDEKIDKSEEASENVAGAGEAETKIESDMNLSGGVMDLSNRDERNSEAENNDEQNNLPEPDLPANNDEPGLEDLGRKTDESGENIQAVNSENADDEKTIIASPEDFQTMLKESVSTNDTVEGEISQPIENELPEAQGDERFQFINTAGAEPENSNNESVNEQQDAALPKEALQSESEPVEEISSLMESPIQDNVVEQSEDIQLESQQPEGIQNIEDAAEQTLQVEPAAGAEEQVEGIQPEPAAEAVSDEIEPVLETQQTEEIKNIEDAAEQTLQAEPVAGAEEQVEGIQPEPALTEAMSEEPEPVLETQQTEEIKNIEDTAEQTLSDSSAAEQDDDKTLVLESSASVFSNEAPGQSEGLNDAEAADIQPSNDLQSPSLEGAQDSGEETMMAAPEDNPSITNRKKFTGNISELIEKQIPDGIPDERIKPIIFLYAMTDESLCADIINTLDSICLKSKTKPMFIKRPVVKVCDPEMKGEYAMQLVNEHEALGLICVGDVPQDTVYEIQNAFNTKENLFRHITKENFNYALTVDIVADLILM